MKSKYLISAALSGLFGLLVAFSASAQRRGGGGGGSHGGGGFHGGGGSFGGGFHSSGSVGRSSGFSGRSSGSFNRSYSTPQRSYSTPRGYNNNTQRSYNTQRGAGIQSYHGNPGVTMSGRYNSAPRSAYSNRAGIVGRGYAGSRSYIGRGYHGYSYRPYTYRGHVYYRPYNRFYRYNYYSRYYYPHLGFHLSVLPFGYYPFWWDGYQYFYSDGYYYQYDNDEYTVVEPPLGAVLDKLPAGAQSLMIDGEQYYEQNGVYYQAVTKDDGRTGYQVAGKDGQLNTGSGNDDVYQDDNGTNQDNGQYDQPQQPVAKSQGDVQAPLKVGDMLESLPPHTSKVKIDGQQYYLSQDGYYFQEDRDSSNRKVYRVAGTATDGLNN